MSQKINVLVFPCGSEIGLEIYRSLRYSTHINLFGANSMDDHGRFVYEQYISGLPFYNQPNFIPALKKVIQKHNIDVVYPAMDSVITELSINESILGCKVIGSDIRTNRICLSKLKTYKVLGETMLVPKIYPDLESVKEYPVFMKPEVGYGSRGAKLINSKMQGEEHLTVNPSCIILEYLPGNEYTVDCFTDKNGTLRFAKARQRRRIMNGISVNTAPVYHDQEKFEDLAKRINGKLSLRGAWFFQVKEDQKKELRLLEVATRLGGSSSLFRALGVNFALLSVFDAFDYDVDVYINDFEIEMDRALDNRYRTNISYSKVYLDFDDCILLGNTVNIELIALIYQFLNEGKKLILITKHEKDISQTLRQFRLFGLFDEIIQLKKEDLKYKKIDADDSIFIDDSFAERSAVYKHLQIPVFSPDNINCLFK